MERKIDLHIHTNCSDGYLTAKEVIDEAKKNSVSIISIADHDTVMAYTDEIIKYAKDSGITLIPAVEMSTRLNTGFHVLGYNMDITNKKFLKTLDLLKNARLDYLNKVSTALQNLGYHIDKEELMQLPTVTKAHISRHIIAREDNKDLIMKTFGHMANMGEFIEAIMNEGCPAFVEKFSITPIEASKIIHEAGGKVVLAHPVAYVHEDGITANDIKKLVKDMQADGIESNYLYVNAEGELFVEVDYWNEFAKENNLFTTIGSDFHEFDATKPYIGFTNTDFYITNEQINSILNNLVTNN